MNAKDSTVRRRWRLGRWGWWALALASLALLIALALRVADVPRLPVQVQEQRSTVERAADAVRNAVLGSRERADQKAGPVAGEWRLGPGLHWFATAIAVLAALMAVITGLAGGLAWELVFGIVTLGAAALVLQTLVGLAIALVVIVGLIGMLGQLGDLFDGSSCCDG